MQKWEPHDDETLQYASDLLEYHINQYISTLHWLEQFEHERQTRGRKKDTAYNGVLESHMVHARALTRFLEPLPSRPYPTDIFALEYFQDNPDEYEPLKDEFLNDVATKVGSLMVHITCKGMPKLKSQQEWPVPKMANKLIPALHNFVTIAPDERFKEGHKEACLKHLAKVLPPD